MNLACCLPFKKLMVGENLHGVGPANNFRALFKDLVMLGSSFVALQAF